VTSELGGARLDQVAARMFGDFSRERLKRWIASGELQLNGAMAKVTARVREGDRLVLNAEVGQDEDWHSPQVVPFDVAYESADVIVVDKPAGVVMHPGAGVRDGTLVNGLLERFPELAHLPRAGIVHRLDKDTSGLVLVGRTLPAHTRLVRALAAREVGRRYLLVVAGEVAAGFTVDAPIARHPVVRTRMAVVPGGRVARTDVVPLACVAGRSLLEATLHTGRTHQIRVHLAHVGHPLLGDRVYGVPAPELDRQALHAWRLAFEDAGEAVRVRSQPPQAFLAAVRRWGFSEDAWQAMASES
jgi:23S rRNA pseudouridine1911/1915/1917 synthase